MRGVFGLSDVSIRPRDLDCSLAGGFVVFEGKVRDNSMGKSVLAIEYEAFSDMAVQEGENLLAEAIERYGLIAAEAEHRTGKLLVGETAVWIAVAAPHRKEAFAACEFIIDEIKKRVPIWKKEHFADGDSGWVHCYEPAE
ncbi:MAG: molybdenum cofactor biosynthesis protein MoaE [Armatimonadetes bacterium]|nr:molybdenum cofactor biosynthesis protein MoaE [Armatimonadota bacterium]